MKLPGLIDPHVHMREPGAIHKEDWASGTASALAGGITAVLTMPNTQPPVVDANSLTLVEQAAGQKAHCDYAHFLGAGPDNAQALKVLAPQAAGLKMYLDQTYGPLRLDDLTVWMSHFEHWPKDFPIVAHAEGRTMAAVILLAAIFDRPVHIAHVSLREEILVIRAAKERGLRVTCEVTPHHLFLSQEDIPAIGKGRSEVRPDLATPGDVQALWQNLDVIDCFATDHAPHTLQEKDGEKSPPGFPGLETALPLFLTAVHQGKLEISDVVQRMYTNPRNIFKLPEQPDTWVEVDADVSWEIRTADLHSRCAWTPYEGRRVFGRIQRVFLRGSEVYRDGKVLTHPGFGKNLRSQSSQLD
jgi:carbamoyl-phosphate synthase/aspartate carbamoyltransferase/dihydroorotase